MSVESVTIIVQNWIQTWLFERGRISSSPLRTSPKRQPLFTHYYECITSALSASSRIVFSEQTRLLTTSHRPDDQHCMRVTLDQCHVRHSKCARRW